MPNAPLVTETPIEAEQSTPEEGFAEFFAGMDERLKALEAQVATHVEPDAHNALYGGLEQRIGGLEQALTRIAGGALQLQLGAPELSAIGDALKSRMEQAVHDCLQQHYGFTPPAGR